jgi:hypothetical protein
MPDSCMDHATNPHPQVQADAAIHHRRASVGEPGAHKPSADATVVALLLPHCRGQPGSWHKESAEGRPSGLGLGTNLARLAVARKPVGLHSPTDPTGGQYELARHVPAAGHRPPDRAGAAHIVDKAVRQPHNRTATPTGVHTAVVVPDRHIGPSLAAICSPDRCLTLIHRAHDRSQ